MSAQEMLRAAISAGLDAALAAKRGVVEPEQTRVARLAASDLAIEALIDEALAKPPHPWDPFIAGWFWFGSAVVASWGDYLSPSARKACGVS